MRNETDWFIQNHSDLLRLRKFRPCGELDFLVGVGSRAQLIDHLAIDQHQALLNVAVGLASRA